MLAILGNVFYVALLGNHIKILAQRVHGVHIHQITGF